MSLKDGFLRLIVWPFRKSDSLARDHRGSPLPWWGLCVALTAGIMMTSCATPHATLEFTAPANVTAGTPFTVTVIALYQGKPDTVINSPIHFTSSDSAAILPGNYYFTASDAGSHTFTNAFVLATTGSQTISGYIYFDPSMTKSGISGKVAITVSP